VSVPAPCACGSRSLGYLRGAGREQPKASPAPPCRQLPAAQLNLWTGKRPFSSETASGPISFWLPNNTGLAIGRDDHWKRAPCGLTAPRRLRKRRRGGEGAATGGCKAGRLGASLRCSRWARIPCYKHFLLRVILFGFHLEVLKIHGTASQRKGKMGLSSTRAAAVPASVWLDTGAEDTAKASRYPGLAPRGARGSLSAGRGHPRPKHGGRASVRPRARPPSEGPGSRSRALLLRGVFSAQE